MAEELFRLFTPAGSSARIIEMELPLMIDSTEFDRLNDALLTLVAPHTSSPWIIDLGHVSYMGSAMLGLMVNLRQRIKAGGGQLVLCSMPPSLLRIFKTCCMERLFVIARMREDALRMVR